MKISLSAFHDFENKYFILTKPNLINTQFNTDI